MRFRILNNFLRWTLLFPDFLPDVVYFLRSARYVSITRILCSSVKTTWSPTRITPSFKSPLMRLLGVENHDIPIGPCMDSHGRIVGLPVSWLSDMGR